MRQDAAYVLLLILAVGIAVLIGWLRHNSPQRRYRRQQKRDRDRHSSIMAQKAEDQDARP